MYAKMKKSLGNKRVLITEGQIAEIVKAYAGNVEGATFPNEYGEAQKPDGKSVEAEPARIVSKMLDTTFFGFRKVTVDRPPQPGKLVTVKPKKGQRPYDPDLRDTENIPLAESIPEYIKREVLPHVPDAFVNEDDAVDSVLVVTRGMILAHTFPVARNAVPVTINQDMKALRPRSGTDARYLAWMLVGLESLMLSLTDESAHGTKALRADQWKNLPIPIPGPGVQTGIANFLDAQTARIDLLIAEKLALGNSLRLYLQSYLSHRMTSGADAAVEMRETSFPELGALPAHWTIERLKFLGSVRSGITKGKDFAGKQSVKLPYLRVANVQDGYVDLTELSEIEVSFDDAERCLLRRGDVLMNEGGDNDKLGRGTVWQAQVEPCLHQNHVFAVRLHASNWPSGFRSLPRLWRLEPTFSCARNRVPTSLPLTSLTCLNSPCPCRRRRNEF